ncbi:MAG: hypothetical protein ACRBBR_06520 [Cellvibrionaceae bacterium]
MSKKKPKLVCPDGVSPYLYAERVMSDAAPPPPASKRKATPPPYLTICPHHYDSIVSKGGSVYAQKRKRSYERER